MRDRNKEENIFRKTKVLFQEDEKPFDVYDLILSQRSQVKRLHLALRGYTLLYIVYKRRITVNISTVRATCIIVIHLLRGIVFYSLSLPLFRRLSLSRYFSLSFSLSTTIGSSLSLFLSQFRLHRF